MSRVSAAGSSRSANRALMGALTLVAALALWVPAPPVGAQGMAAGVNAATGCGPVNGLHFVCGAHHPEDMARIPGTPWVIVSAFALHGGLQLLDTRALTLRRWYSGSPIQRDAGKHIGAADCPGPLQGSELDTQGLSLRALGPERYRLYAVNHGGRESIEIFDVSLAGGVPVPRWRGCVLMPAGDAANAVSSYPDGTIIATVLNLPGTSKADFVRGKPTGGVFEWRPGTEGFRLLPGTELPGNNGLAASPDGRAFYVIAFGTHSVAMYSRRDTRRPLRRAPAPGFMPDNIHWDGQRLIAAGMTYDEPACGGVRKIVNGRADPMRCHRGYIVAAVDPKTLRFTVLAHAGPNPAFNGVTTGLIVGSRLWLASYQADRVAYRELPGPAPAPAE